MSAKNNILKKIRQALATPVPAPFPGSENKDDHFQLSTRELELEFAEKFTKLLGKFSFCNDEKELAQQLNTLFKARHWTMVYCNEKQVIQTLEAQGLHLEGNDIRTCQAAITSCEALVARTGSILMTTAQTSGRTTSVYAPVHICIAYTDQLIYDIKDGLKQLKNKYKDNFPSLVTLATGPSRTADIEKTLVVGIHGPKEVLCFLVDRQQP